MYAQEIRAARETIMATVNSVAFEDAAAGAPSGTGWDAEQLRSMAATVRDRAAELERMAEFLAMLGGAEGAA